MINSVEIDLLYLMYKWIRSLIVLQLSIFFNHKKKSLRIYCIDWAFHSIDQLFKKIQSKNIGKASCATNLAIWKSMQTGVKVNALTTWLKCNKSCFLSRFLYDQWANIVTCLLIMLVMWSVTQRKLKYRT